MQPHNAADLLKNPGLLVMTLHDHPVREENYLNLRNEQNCLKAMLILSYQGKYACQSWFGVP